MTWSTKVPFPARQKRKTKCHLGDAHNEYTYMKSDSHGFCESALRGLAPCFKQLLAVRTFLIPAAVFAHYHTATFFEAPTP